MPKVKHIDRFLHAKLYIRIQNINERAIVSMCLSGFEPARLRGFTSEVSHTYGIFHYVLKRAKSNRRFFYLNYLRNKSPGGFEPPSFPSGTL